MNRFRPEINIQTPQPSAAQGPRPSRTSKQILPYTKHYDPKWTLETGPGWSTAPTLNRTGTVIRGDDPSRLPAKYQAEQQEEHSRRTSSNTTASSNYSTYSTYSTTLVSLKSTHEEGIQSGP